MIQLKEFIVWLTVYVLAIVASSTAQIASISIPASIAATATFKWDDGTSIVGAVTIAKGTWNGSQYVYAAEAPKVLSSTGTVSATIIVDPAITYQVTLKAPFGTVLWEQIVYPALFGGNVKKFTATIVLRKLDNSVSSIRQTAYY